VILLSAIGLDKVIPVSKQDIRPCTVRTGGRAGDRVAEGASSMMVIELLVEGSIPEGPVE
jgi:hypothetical protein